MRDALAAGVHDKRISRADLISPFHGVRVPSDIPLDLEMRCRALATRFRDGDAFTGVTAAGLAGAPLPARASRGPLRVVSHGALAPMRRRGVIGTNRMTTDTHLIAGIPVVPPLDAAVAACREVASHDVTAILDFYLTGDRGIGALLSIDQLNRYVMDTGGVAGIATFRRAAVMARVGSWARPETLTRVLLDRAGFPRAELNQPLTSTGILIPDLSWPRYRVALEYNGGHHDSPDRHSLDLSRLDRYADIGWSVLNVERSELFDRPGSVIARTARRLISRGWTGFGGYEIAETDRFER